MLRFLIYQLRQSSKMNQLLKGYHLQRVKVCVKVLLFIVIYVYPELYAPDTNHEHFTFSVIGCFFSLRYFYRNFKFWVHNTKGDRLSGSKNIISWGIWICILSVFIDEKCSNLWERGKFKCLRKDASIFLDVLRVFEHLKVDVQFLSSMKILTNLAYFHELLRNVISYTYNIYLIILLEVHNELAVREM